MTYEVITIVLLLIVGILVGLAWPRGILSMVPVATLAAVIVAMAADPLGGVEAVREGGRLVLICLSSMFKSIDNFIVGCVYLSEYFTRILVPGIAGALIAFTLKKQCLNWLRANSKKR
jgi:uncharacterized membrane protein